MTFDARLLLEFDFLGVVLFDRLQKRIHTENFGSLLHMLESVVDGLFKQPEVRLALVDGVAEPIVIRQEHLSLLAKIIHEH